MNLVRSAAAAAAGAAVLLISASAGAGPGAQSFALKGVPYRLVPWDYGAPFRCRTGTHMGVMLTGPRGRVWSFAPYRDLASLQRRGCGAGTVASTVVGVGVERAAHFAVVVRSCAANCGGYDFYAFAFNGVRTDEELGETLGGGGWRFAFPVLVLYVNKAPQECPSHWKRLSYRWIGGYRSSYVLQRSEIYTGRQCAIPAPKKWPPDPGDRIVVR